MRVVCRRLPDKHDHIHISRHRSAVCLHSVTTACSVLVSWQKEQTVILLCSRLAHVGWNMWNKRAHRCQRNLTACTYTETNPSPPADTNPQPPFWKNTPSYFRFWWKENVHKIREYFFFASFLSVSFSYVLKGSWGVQGR